MIEKPLTKEEQHAHVQTRFKKTEDEKKLLKKLKSEWKKSQKQENG